mmetsp:Transcript_7423/g.17901  ORF Transcript_7423/g.17901 Transcript_7423/m.17901 type:complete len:219 (-) Transcript_7423:169-825(-)
MHADPQLVVSVGHDHQGVRRAVQDLGFRIVDAEVHQRLQKQLSEGSKGRAVGLCLRDREQHHQHPHHQRLVLDLEEAEDSGDDAQVQEHGAQLVVEQHLWDELGGVRVHLDGHLLIDQQVGQHLQPSEAHEVLHSFIIHAEVVQRNERVVDNVCVAVDAALAEVRQHPHPSQRADQRAGVRPGGSEPPRVDRPPREGCVHIGLAHPLHTAHNTLHTTH